MSEPLKVNPIPPPADAAPNSPEEHSGFMARIEHALGALAVRAHRRPAFALLLAAVLTAIGGFVASGLPLNADLVNLLPKSFESVRGLEPVKERFGGIGYIVIVGMGADATKLKEFADEYAPKLEQLEGIRYVDYKRSARFFEERALYYLSLDDLKEVQTRIKQREKYERRQMNPMLVKLDDEEPPSLDMSDIEAKYGKRSDQRLAGSGEEHYVDGDKQMIVLMAKPAKSSTDLNYADQLVKKVEEYFEKEKPNLAKYGPNFHIGLTGQFKYKVDQQRQLSSDMARASILAFILLFGYLVFHFRSVLAVLLVNAPVFAGLAWTYGLTYGIFGSLNILTGFLGAILGGLGTEHGIHMLGRYQVLRSEGVDSESATREVFQHTGGSALVSSLVAALTFGCIGFSEFRAFREFGVIAAIGMIVVVAAYVLILPGLLGLANSFGWKPSKGAAMAGQRSELARLIPRSFRAIALVSALVLVALIGQMGRIHFDFDFHSLEDSQLPSYLLDKETNRILGYTNEPVVILTDKAESERALVDALKARQKSQGEKSTIDFVAALDDLVPPQQQEKKEVFEAIGKTLAKVNANNLDAATKPKFEKLLKMVNAQPFVRTDIPISVRRQFEGVGGASGGFVLIFPNIVLSDGMQVRAFAKEVRGIELPGGEKFSAAGEPMILADVLEMVIRESPPILLAAVLSVLIAMWVTLGSLRTALICYLPTAVSLFAQVGYMAMLGLKFNYLNILIVPVLIGTTVDAGVHLVSRLSEGHNDFAPVFAETGRAIVGGLITSGVGFGAMLLADHPGLNSMGRLANLGFAMNLSVMLVAFPAFMLLLQKARKSEPAAK